MLQKLQDPTVETQRSMHASYKSQRVVKLTYREEKKLTFNYISAPQAPADISVTTIGNGERQCAATLFFFFLIYKYK